MKVVETELEGVYIIEPMVFRDQRGWFLESYSKKKLPEICTDFVQDNHSYSAEKNVLRGIHFQLEPYAQAKLVRCIAGAVMDFAVDLRKGSPTYKKWIGVELSNTNKRMLYLPRGFGHGFITLTADVEFVYKTDNYYNQESDRSIRFDDPELNINWGTDNPILSEKDQTAPLFSESDCNFVYGEI